MTGYAILKIPSEFSTSGFTTDPTIIINIVNRHRSENSNSRHSSSTLLWNASLYAGTKQELSTSADPKGGLKTVRNEAKWPMPVMNFSSLRLRHLLFVRILRNHPGCFAHTANDLSGPSNSLSAIVRDRQINKLRERKKYRKINLLLLNYFPHTAAHELKKESFLLISAIIERINIH